MTGPHRRRRLGTPAAFLAALLLLAPGPATATTPGVAAAAPSPGPSSTASAAATHVPVLAYYYMWFNATSWTHTKTDLPALGAYDSTDPAVIHQQVTWARESGIDAFIVSWKGTAPLDKALAQLVAECRSQGLKLVLMYEGLDVNRNPISIKTVAADLYWFMGEYGNDPVFNLFGKTAIVWAGSWRFSDADVSSVRALIGAPDSALLLGAEKSGATYAARASLLDGDAYYWSSADPLSTPGYQSRLNDLAAAVHADGGLWLPPATVGFDARLNGGTSVVDRRAGKTLRTAWADAMATRPEGLAVIAWNEFTENSYLEPSRKYGLQYLQVLAELTGAPGPTEASLPTPAPPTPGVTPSPSPTSPPPAEASTGRGVPRPPTSGDYMPAVLASLLGFGLIGLLGFSLRRRAGRSESLGRPAE